METFRAAVVQFEHAAGDKEANFGKIEKFAAQAAGEGVKLITFPECCITGYWFLTRRTREELVGLAERVPTGPSARRVTELAKQHRMTIGAGLVEIEGEKLFNTYVVATASGEIHRHRKIQAFEHEAISAGSEYTVFDTPEGVKVGVLICYDNNIVENVRITALMGAQVLMAPHQTGGCNSASPHGMKPIDVRVWQERKVFPQAIKAELVGPKGRGWLMRWLPARAHDNGMFVLFSNGVGIDDDEVRTGNAMILDPYGRTVNSTDVADDAMVVGDLDLSLVPMSTGRRWLSARRPELYGLLCKPTGMERDMGAVRFGRSHQ